MRFPATECGNTLGLIDDELAFCDVLETNDSAVKVMGDETLCWTPHESVQANRRLVVFVSEEHHGRQV